jgi:hypothetical protein
MLDGKSEITRLTFLKSWMSARKLKQANANMQDAEVFPLSEFCKNLFSGHFF